MFLKCEIAFPKKVFSTQPVSRGSDALCAERYKVGVVTWRQGQGGGSELQVGQIRVLFMGILFP